VHATACAPPARNPDLAPSPRTAPTHPVALRSGLRKEADDGVE
jgi:hypothetical protein